jgi:hypothetical protein
MSFESIDKHMLRSWKMADRRTLAVRQSPRWENCPSESHEKVLRNLEQDVLRASKSLLMTFVK